MKSEVLTDAQVGTALGVILADEELGAAALAVLPEALAVLAREAADVSALDFDPSSRVDEVVLVLLTRRR